MRLQFLTSIFGVLLALHSYAEPLSPVSITGAVLGIPCGVYEGQGTLVSKTPFVPNLQFRSVRKIVDNKILVKTKASKFGIVLAEASARLEVVPVSENRFELWDLDNKRKGGEGFCGSESCSLEVSVMPKADGTYQLSLKETWVPDEGGFRVIDGSQVFDRKAAQYEGIFKIKDNEP